MSEREKHICLDPGHDAGNLANKSPDGTYYEHVFTLDLGKRLEKPSDAPSFETFPSITATTGI